jgi:hypothetical protein
MSIFIKITAEIPRGSHPGKLASPEGAHRVRGIFFAHNVQGVPMQ